MSNFLNKFNIEENGDFYSYKIIDGKQYVEFGEPLEIDGKRVDIDGYVPLEIATQRGLNELKEFISDYKGVDDIIDRIENYEEDTIYRYEDSTRIYLNWIMLMYFHDDKSIIYSVRAY